MFVASRLPNELVGVMVGSCCVKVLLVSLVGVLGDRVVTRLADSADSADSIRLIRITEHTEHGSRSVRTFYVDKNGMAYLRFAGIGGNGPFE